MAQEMGAAFARKRNRRFFPHAFLRHTTAHIQYEKVKAFGGAI